jgi:hypothetical protein
MDAQECKGGLKCPWRKDRPDVRGWAGVDDFESAGECNG